MDLFRLASRWGILQGGAAAYLQGAGADSGGLDDERIRTLIAEHRAARKAKQWSEADRIRDQLAAVGIVLEEGPGGTTWRRG